MNCKRCETQPVKCVDCWVDQQKLIAQLQTNAGMGKNAPVFVRRFD